MQRQVISSSSSPHPPPLAPSLPLSILLALLATTTAAPFLLVSSCNSSSSSPLESQDDDKATKKKKKKRKPKKQTAEGASVAAATTTPTSEATQDEDPYDNLPETDEPTECFLCQTHRKGPCRQFWRKFEYCVKDQSKRQKEADQRASADTSNGEGDSAASAVTKSTVCDKYVLPFQECWLKHINLYKIVALEVNRTTPPLLYLLEEGGPNGDDVRSWEDAEKAPHVDWTTWNEFVSQEGALEAAKQMVRGWEKHFTDNAATSDEISGHTMETVPLWQRYEKLGIEPVFISTICHIPTHQKDGMVLRVAYVVDQDDQVIGMTEYDAAALLANADSNNSNQTSHELTLLLLPGMTQSIQINALYSTDKKGGESSGAGMESILYKGSRTPLPMFRYDIDGATKKIL